MNLSKLIVGLTIVLSAFSCKEEEKKVPQPNINFSKDDSADLNRQLIKELNFTIDQYVQRNGWDVTTTPTGLRYMVYEKGEGLQAKTGMIAVIEFDISLLEGTVCYSSKDEGVKSFKIEESDVESGLHEAVLNMKVGDRAKVIIPHYKAHGLIGDSKRIPPLSPIIYDVHLIALSDY